MERVERVERVVEVSREAAVVASAWSPSSSECALTSMAECRLRPSTSGEQGGDIGERTVAKKEFLNTCLVFDEKFRII